MTAVFTIRAGRLDREITLQHPAATIGLDGTPAIAWTTLRDPTRRTP